MVTDVYSLLLFVMLASQIRIRGITEEDESNVYDYASHELIAATTNVPHPYPRDAAIVFIRESLQKAAIRQVFVFAVLADEHFVGLVSIHRQPLISINFGIAVPFWNKGYATAAVFEAIAYAKKQLEARCIESTCLRENIASKRVMQKNGFRKVTRYVRTDKTQFHRDSYSRRNSGSVNRMVWLHVFR